MNLNEKILFLTMDNDITIVLCDKYMTNKFNIVWNDSEFQHYWYAAHILNITINHKMQLRVRIIDKIRTFINKIHHFIVLYNALHSYYKIIKKDYLKSDFNIVIR